MSIMYVQPDEAVTLRGCRGFISRAEYVKINGELVPGEIGRIDGVRIVTSDQIDPALREQQNEIRKKLSRMRERGWARIYPDEVAALQGQCAIIGHVATVIKGPEREVCFYCGAKI